MSGSVLPIGWRVFWYASCAVLVASLLHGSATAGAVERPAPGPRGIWRVLSDAGVPMAQELESDGVRGSALQVILGKGRRAVVESLAGLTEEELLGQLSLVEAELRARLRALASGRGDCAS